MLFRSHIPSEYIMIAKKEYQKTTGKIYEDDKSYNTRMALFLEWYLLDYYEPGTHRSILENIIEDNSSSWTLDRREACKDISNNIQALFEIKKVRDNSVTVLDLFSDEKYLVEEEDSKLVFRKNDIFQGRIFPHQDKYFFFRILLLPSQQNTTIYKRRSKRILFAAEILEKRTL